MSDHRFRGPQAGSEGSMNCATFALGASGFSCKVERIFDWPGERFAHESPQRARDCMRPGTADQQTSRGNEPREERVSCA